MSTTDLSPTPSTDLVFTMDQIEISKSSTSRRKRATGTDGETVVVVSAPSLVLDRGNWVRLGDHNKLRCTVEARICFETGKAAKKTDLVWAVYAQGKPLVRFVSFDSAIQTAKSFVFSANKV